MGQARSGVLCGVYPRRLSIHRSGRTVYSSAWRGDRSTLLDAARRLERDPAAGSLFAQVVVYVWDDPARPDRRSKRMRELHLDELAASLLAEEASRAAARARRVRSIRWRS